ncbi:hypothetical protein HETIRDRAFT_331559, partial [Heterobasidion irregulare TC 32-1]
FVLVIHLFEESRYPFQHTRYWYLYSRFLPLRISLTLYSSCPFMRSGGCS